MQDNPINILASPRRLAWRPNNHFDSIHSQEVQITILTYIAWILAGRSADLPGRWASDAG